MRLGVPSNIKNMFDSPSIGGFGEILQLQNLTKDRCLTLPQAETKKLKEENQRHKEPEDPSEKKIETDFMVSFYGEKEI